MKIIKGWALFLVLFSAGGAWASFLKLEWQNYSSAPSLKTQSLDYVFLKWDQKLDFFAGPFYFDGRVQSEYSLDSANIFYFNVPELYFSYKYELERPLFRVESIELDVGRKAKDWSVADKYWEMGLWNPQTRWNPLHPETNGLTGSFLTLKAGQWSADMFLGALYLPNQDAQFIEEGGVAYSRSRWFYPLPNQVDILNIDIFYSARRPYIYDVLFQQSYLLSFKTWSKTKETYYWMKWSIADKPVNHLFFVLNETNLYRIEKEKGAVGRVDQNISALPVRQRILSAEWGLNYNNFSAVFTLESVKKKEADIRPEDWDFVNLRDNFAYFSALFKYDVSPKSFIQAGYIQSWFKNYNVQSLGSGAEKPPSILQKQKVLEGIGLDGQTEFVFSSGLKGLLAFSYRFSFLNEGGWLFLRALRHITPDIYTELTVDVLGAVGADHYFLSRFRHNDYFSWSLAYEF